jgi:DNA repair exonuclease SbcCD nuclease subunit
MIFSHISDTHLGLAQYGSEERESDVYYSFNEAVDISIKDHVDFVIFAGDIFHAPNPNGNAIVQMANALKRLKQNSIDSFFVLGEHDISRIRATPIPYVYHNLEFSKYIGQGTQLIYKNVLLVGFDKIRKSEIPYFEEKFAQIDSIAKKFSGHKILVLHQGITEFNKFAGELTSYALPRNFTYYAMGHLHDHEVKMFNHLKGPVAYPGSTEITPSEGIKETAKGFFEVDISSSEVRPNWIKLDTRPQFSFKIEYNEFEKSVERISSKIANFERKPIVELKILGKNIEPNIVQSRLSHLDELTLRCFWKIITKGEYGSKVFLERPNIIDAELLKLSTNALGSEKLAKFAIQELLPLLSAKQLNEAIQIILENFEQYKKETST